MAFMLLSGFWICFLFILTKCFWGVFFSLQFQTVSTSVILNFLVFTSSCLLKRHFFQFRYLGNFKDQATVCRVHIHVCVLMWVFLLSLPGTEKKN